MNRTIAYLVATLIVCVSAAAQSLPMLRPVNATCVELEHNRLVYPGDSTDMQRFYSRLDSLALFGEGKINIVQIGGSHVQADIFSNRLRRNLAECLPGMESNRGLIFPFSAARTNNPVNYNIKYTGTWSRSQISRPPLDEPVGMAGYAVTTTDTASTIAFLLNPSYTDSHWMFNKVRVIAQMHDTIFIPMLVVSDDTIAPTVENDVYTYSLHSYVDAAQLIIVRADKRDYYNNQYNNDIWTGASLDVDFASAEDSLTIGLESDNGLADSLSVDSAEVVAPRAVYDHKIITINAIFPENDFNGITLHAMGVNGASLVSWLRSARFEEELALVSPDLAILAIGINDANVPFGQFDASIYKSRYSQLITKIKRANPECAIIFVTNNDCNYRIGRRYRGVNRNTPLVQKAIYELAQAHNAAVWDLFEIMGGSGSMQKWVAASLANRDKVHFLATGYALLGDLLYNAIIYDWLYK